MQKKKVFNIEDSNIANIGSDLNKKVRQEAGKGEKAWEKAGKKPGLQIWRIEKFKVIESKTEAGTFYSDDSYICLNTYKKKDNDKLFWDIHFWLGETTSQDEAGTAAYKTVELDDFLGGGPVQHREVMGKESGLFLTYFKDGIRLLEGGVESGFNKVKPEEYKPRLLHLKGRKKIRISQVPFKVESLNSGDVFIADCGLKLYQWQGKGAGIKEKSRAGQLARAIDDERKGKPEVEVLAQGDKDAGAFWKLFGLDAEPDIPDGGDDEEWEKKGDKVLMSLSDSSGSVEFKEVAKGKVTKDMFKTEDAFVFDIGNEVFAWVGKGASKGERDQALHYVQVYLKKYNRPSYLPICKIYEGGENEVFEQALD